MKPPPAKANHLVLISQHTRQRQLQYTKIIQMRANLPTCQLANLPVCRPANLSASISSTCLYRHLRHLDATLLPSLDEKL